MKNYLGKLVGGALGFALGGGPLGAFLGVLVGHAYDSRRDPLPDFWGEANSRRWKDTYSGNPVDNLNEAAFTKAVVVLCAKMAKVDGSVTRSEIEAFKKVFKIQKQQEDGIGKLFDEARRSAEGFEPYAFQVAQRYRNHPVVLEHILGGLFVIAAADSETIRPAEAKFLRQVAYIFNFTPDDFVRLAARSGVYILPDSGSAQPGDSRKHSADDQSYEILGVSEKAKDDEIKSAYRALVQKYHPDRLMAEGVPPEFIATANEKMKRINVAYEKICKSRGIKV
ncbi:MAG: TerB family tellurite resistance protein [Bdellovibrionales bacterium]